MKHLLVTQDFAPDLGGMARRHVELARRFGDGATTMEVSTIAAEGSSAFDSAEPYTINRQPFPFSKAKLFANQIKWGRWLSARSADDIDVLHCGNIRPVGYAVLLAHLRRGVPYLVYVNGGDLLKEQAGIATSLRKRFGCAPNPWRRERDSFVPRRGFPDWRWGVICSSSASSDPRQSEPSAWH